LQKTIITDRNSHGFFTLSAKVCVRKIFEYLVILPSMVHTDWRVYICVYFKRPVAYGISTE